MSFYKLATEIDATLNVNDPNYKLDPAAILALIELLKLLLPIVLDNCNKTPRELPAAAMQAKHGLLRRVAFRILIKRALDRDILGELEATELLAHFHGLRELADAIIQVVSQQEPSVMDSLANSC